MRSLILLLLATFLIGCATTMPPVTNIPLRDSTATIVSHGGSVLLPPKEVPGIVTFALFKDPEGNVMGLVKG